VRRGFIWLLLVAGLAGLPAAADTMSGRVFVVIDGDTVLFRPDHVRASSRTFMKLRLADIDAPETSQPYGDAATRTLTALVLNQPVDIDTLATDAYGRTVARIRTGTLSVNTELVRRGMAWAALRGRRDSELNQAQREARVARRGLWQSAAPIPPWVWRRSQKARMH
jgi:micrococcal nuclease